MSSADKSKTTTAQKPSSSDTGKPTGDNLAHCLDLAVGKFGQKLNTTGIILDATGSYKTPDSLDYVTKLKVIDRSFNFKENPTNYKSFIHVFIYSEVPENAPKVHRVGDIVKLKNFTFCTYQQSEIKAIFRKDQSEWVIYDGRPNANFIPISRSKHTSSSSVSSLDKDGIMQLREWAEKFFEAHSIKSMNWFSRDIVKPTKKGSVNEIRDVDLVVRMLNNASFMYEEKTYHKIVFVDEASRIFLAEYSGPIDHINKDDVVKLRSVNLIIGFEENKIQFSTYSTIIILPKQSMDWKTLEKSTKSIEYSKDKLTNKVFDELHLEKMVKTQVAPNIYTFMSEEEAAEKGHQKLIPKSSFLKSYPILENYSFVEDDFNLGSDQTKPRRGSAFLKYLSTQSYSSLRELAMIQTQILGNDTFVHKYQHQVFIVKASIAGFEQAELTKIAKYYSPRANLIWDFEKYSQASKAANDLHVILHNLFYIKDSSLEGSLTFPVYLISFDGNPQQIFSLWRLLPDYLELKQWQEISNEKQKKFAENMHKLKEPNLSFDLAVQLMVNNQGKVYFRIVDSIFWFPPK